MITTYFPITISFIGLFFSLFSFFHNKAIRQISLFDKRYAFYQKRIKFFFPFIDEEGCCDTTEKT
jgi:hypothetical protein